MNEPAKSLRNLIVWQKAHVLALAIYRETSAFPADEKYGITSQLRRAAVRLRQAYMTAMQRNSPGKNSRFPLLASRFSS